MQKNGIASKGKKNTNLRNNPQRKKRERKRKMPVNPVYVSNEYIAIATLKLEAQFKDYLLLTSVFPSRGNTLDSSKNIRCKHIDTTVDSVTYESFRFLCIM